MRNDHTLPLLQKPIPELGLSQELNNIAEMHGFFSLEALSKLSTDQLLQLPGFTRHLLYEYVNFMEANGYGELIDPM